jgi:hypothetical protein
LNLKRRNERSLRIGSNGHGNGAFVDEDDDVEEDYHITQEHLNQCIKEQKEKEHAIQESFKKDVLNAMPKEIGAKVDPKTGRILERIERGVQKGHNAEATRGRNCTSREGRGRWRRGSRF